MPKFSFNFFTRNPFFFKFYFRLIFPEYKWEHKRKSNSLKTFIFLYFPMTTGRLKKEEKLIPTKPHSLYFDFLLEDNRKESASAS